MKSLINIAITSTALLLSSNVLAAKPVSENQLMTQCKSMAKGQFANVKKVRLASRKNTRGTFTAKFKVIAENDRGMFLCTVERDQAPTIVRLDAPATNIAASE